MSPGPSCRPARHVAHRRAPSRSAAPQHGRSSGPPANRPSPPGPGPDDQAINLRVPRPPGPLPDAAGRTDDHSPLSGPDHREHRTASTSARAPGFRHRVHRRRADIAPGPGDVRRTRPGTPRHTCRDIHQPGPCQAKPVGAVLPSTFITRHELVFGPARGARHHNHTERQSRPDGREYREGGLEEDPDPRRDNREPAGGVLDDARVPAERRHHRRWWMSAMTAISTAGNIAPRSRTGTIGERLAAPPGDER